MNALDRAIAIVGSRAQLARKLGVSKSFVSQLAGGNRPIPIKHAIAIEEATARVVTVEELRPDVEWRVIRGAHDQDREAA